MALLSRLFRGVPALEACLVQDASHVTLGTVGPHVPKIQKALLDETPNGDAIVFVATSSW